MLDSTSTMTIDAEIRVAKATAQVIRFDLKGPSDNVLKGSDRYRIDLCLTPRPPNAVACYSDRWSPHRFERMGKIFMLPPGETVRARSDGNSSLTNVICELRPELMPADGGFQSTNRHLEASLDIQNSTVRSLMIRLAEEARHPGFGGAFLVESIAGQLAVEIARYYGKLNETPFTSGLSSWRLRLIDERLNEPGASPTLYELADLCKLSVRQLSRAFRASRGCTLGNYVAMLQMDHAKRLLLSGETVKFTALTLGFTSVSSFCFAFRRASGVTPREYLQRSPRSRTTSRSNKSSTPFIADAGRADSVATPR